MQNIRTGEIVRVLEVDEDPEAPALEVIRGFAGYTMVPMQPGDELLVIASAAPEAVDAPQPEAAS